MQAPPQPRRWWHRIPTRLSVRAMMVLVFFLSVGLGWIVNRARVQRDAVGFIRKAGGTVIYHWDLKNGKYTPGGKSWWPGWLVDRVGIDYFGDVAMVELRDRGSCDELLVHVGRLSRLERLTVSGSPVTDAGLAHLKGMTNLKWLNLNGTRVTDAGLVHLRGMAGLEELALDRTRVSDAGLAFLVEIDSIQRLHLDGTGVGDAGLAHLGGMASLTWLDLGGTKITDDGLAHLEGLNDLGELFLENNTGVGDAGLTRLGGMASLKGLRVDGTRVSDAGEQKLQRAIPKLSIIR